MIPEYYDIDIVKPKSKQYIQVEYLKPGYYKYLSEVIYQVVPEENYCLFGENTAISQNFEDGLGPLVITLFDGPIKYKWKPYKK